MRLCLETGRTQYSIQRGQGINVLLWCKWEKLISYGDILVLVVIFSYIYIPPLWSSGQSFWLQIQRSRVRSPALPDFLSSSGSGTGSTQPREIKLRSYFNKKVEAPGSENRD